MRQDLLDDTRPVPDHDPEPLRGGPGPDLPRDPRPRDEQGRIRARGVHVAEKGLKDLVSDNLPAALDLSHDPGTAEPERAGPGHDVDAAVRTDGAGFGRHPLGAQKVRHQLGDGVPVKGGGDIRLDASASVEDRLVHADRRAPRRPGGAGIRASRGDRVQPGEDVRAVQLREADMCAGLAISQVMVSG